MDDTRFSPSQLRVLSATIVGSGTVFLDSSIANVALPAIQRDLGMTIAEQQWVASSFLLTLSTLLLVGGRLADQFGRRRVFLVGMIGYAALGTAAALAPTTNFLIGARGAQGVAGALLVPTSLAIVNATFARAVRGKAIGTWSGWSGITTVLGPIVGGLLIDNVTWRAAFLIGPLFSVAAVLLALGISESRDEEAAGRLDVPGAVLAVLGIGGIVLALIQGPIAGWDSPGVIAGATAGALGLPAFLIWERRAASPMLPLDIFENRNLATANAATLFIYAGLYGSFFYVSIYVQSTLGRSATFAGAVFVPVTVMLFFLSPYAGRLNDLHGPRWLMTGGPLVAAAGFVMMGLTGPGQVWTVLVPGIVLLGTGLGFTVAPLTATAIGSAEERRSGVASGLNNAVSRVAGLVAIAAVGVLVVGIWQASLERVIAREDLGEPAIEALSEVKDRAFVLPAEEGVSDPALARARDAALEAAQEAFRDGMLLAAALMLAGCVISAGGIRQEEPGASARPT